MRRGPLGRLVHALAQSGFDASAAKRYNAVRPGYAQEAVTFALNALPNQDSLNLIEIGAGTGKFTRQVLQELGKCKGKVKLLAVEPSEGFRSELQRTTPPPPANVELAVLYGTGSSMPVTEKHECDGVYVAQAFHWMANDDTLLEVHRVLKANAPLVCVWNALDVDVDWIKELEENIIDRFYDPPETPRYLSMKWRSAFETPIAKSLFAKPTRWFGGLQTSYVTDHDVWERVQSISVIHSLSDHAKQAVREQVLELTKRAPQVDGRIKIVYKSEVAIARRL